MEKKEERKLCLLDLPESTLDCILERLSPLDLCRVAEASTCLLHRCRSDGLWGKHIQRKWGRLVGDVAHGEWQRHMMRIINKERPLQQLNPNGLLGSLSGVWPFVCLASYLENPGDYFTNLLLSNNSNMALYISLESGRFWFPAQLYKRRTVHDALLSYDKISNTFRARSPTEWWRVIKKNIQWDRLRLCPVDTPPHTIYASNCWNDLKPGDRIEIQKKRSKGLLYDWYYAVIGHLEACDENENDCRCQYSEMLVVRFMFEPYRPRLRCRKIVLNRNVNGEQANGFWIYGGIRKLENQDELQSWNRIRTTHHLRHP